MKNHIILFVCLFVPILVNCNFEIYMYSGSSTIQVYDDGKPNHDFDYDGQNRFSCQVPDVFHEKSNTLQKNFEIKNKDQAITYKIQAASITANRNVASPSFLQGFPQDIYPGSTISLTLNYQCEDLSQSDLFYTVINIKFQTLNPTTQTSETLEFSYVKQCKDQDYLYYKFDYSLVIVVILTALLALLALKISKVMSTKKKSLVVTLNFPKSFIYFILLIPLILLFNYVNEGFLIVYQVMISIVSFFSFIYISNQLLSNLFIRSKFYRILCVIPKIQLPITFFMIVGAFIGIALIIPWGITNNWILSDIITFFIFLMIINVVKLKKFKNCLFFMLIQISADILWMILFNYVFNKDFSQSQQYVDDKQYNDYFGSKMVLPMKIECFYIKPEYNLNSKCSWISISNLIVPSLFISYFNRYDDYVNASIYTFISFFSYYFGLFLWALIQSKISIAIPLSIYCYPIMCILCAILAFKRNEHYEIWNGLFPDMGLEDPIIKSQDLLEESKNKDSQEEIKKVDRDDLANFEGGSFPEGKSVSLSMKQALL